MKLGFLKTKFLAVFIAMFFMILPVFAQENIISSVTISKAKDKTSSYELNIDSTDSASYKINIEDSNNIYFDLKNSVLADDSATYYEDVSNIDSVIVKQIGKNKVRIYVQGKNAKNTQLIFLNSILQETVEPSKKVTINRPINEYIATRSQDLDDQDTIQDWDDNSVNFSQLLSYLKEGPLGVVLIFLTIFGLIIGAIRALGGKISQEKEPLIGLNNRRQTNSLDAIYSSKPKADNSLPDISKRSQALQNVQNELTKAHQKYQEYLNAKYNNNPPKKQIPIDAITKGIALNQYSKSTQNPYNNQPVIKMSEILSKQLSSKGNFQIPPKTDVQQKNTSPYIQRPSKNINMQQIDKKPTNLKFLESVTKIYEQSGRSDLANGLKNSITKAKQSV